MILTVIALMTDFGLRDPYVGMMKAVILNINVDAVIVDLTHDIPKYNILLASHILKISYKYFPKGTIFTVVVDPGVGSRRRPIILTSRNYIFVGPDNGVLIPTAKDDGLLDAYEINVKIAGLKEVSYTFHGRDVFAPTAAYLSLGIKPSALGYRLNPDELIKITELPEEPLVTEEGIKLRVIHIDDFGNLIFNTDITRLTKYLGIEFGDEVLIEVHGRTYKALVVRTFSETCKGCLAIYEGSFKLVELAKYLGSASRDLGVNVNDYIILKTKY